MAGGADLRTTTETRWTTNISFPQISAGNVTIFAPHEAFKSIAPGKSTLAGADLRTTTDTREKAGPRSRSLAVDTCGGESGLRVVTPNF
jgi:hypothetical protein